MNHILTVMLLVSSTLFCVGCASWWSSEESARGNASSNGEGALAPAKTVSKERAAAPGVPAKASDAEPVKTVSSSDEQVGDQVGLSQARLADRMSDIEAELRRQREKIRLLEQGLLTGIAPEDLKVRDEGKLSDASDPARKTDVKIPKKVETSHEDLTLAGKESESSPLKEPTLDPEMFPATEASKNGSGGKESPASKLDAMIGKVKSKYQSADFSGAVANLAAMSRQFGENAGGGVIRYWLGKSYLGLKEVGTARAEFEAYLALSPSGSTVADARLGLAKCLSRLGLKERARNELKRVVKDFDGEEAAEIAAHELSSMQGAL